MAITAGNGTMAGDGIVLITLGDITPVIGAEATGVAGMAADIGDIITTGMVVLAGAGADVYKRQVDLYACDNRGRSESIGSLSSSECVGRRI